MTELKTSHFTLDRMLPGAPSKAWRFWSDPALKQAWSGCHPDWTELEVRQDFRMGGHDYSRLRAPDGGEHVVDIAYLDLLEPQRIVYAYSMRLDDQPVSASLVSIVLRPHARGTLMRYDEHLTMLDGSDGSTLREIGTGHGFDRLVQVATEAL